MKPRICPPHRTSPTSPPGLEAGLVASPAPRQRSAMGAGVARVGAGEGEAKGLAQGCLVIRDGKVLISDGYLRDV